VSGDTNRGGIRIQPGQSDVGFVEGVGKFIEVESERSQQLAVPCDIAIGILGFRTGLPR
jgi:hypothetical protein